LTTTGNWNVATTTLGQNDTIQFLGNSAQASNGAINATVQGFGGILVGNGSTTSDVTFNGVLGGTALGFSTVGLGSKATYNANATYAPGSVYTNTGTTVIAQSATVTAESFTDAGSYVLNVVDANGTLANTDFGRLTDSNNGSTITNSRLSVNLTGDIGTGPAASVLTGVNAGAGTLADNSIQYTFVTANNGVNTDITVGRVTTQSLATESNVGAATTFEGLRAASLAGTANTQLAAIIDNLASAPTQVAFNEALEAAGPTVDGGAVVGGYNASLKSLDVSNTRLASLRNGTETAMVAGETGNGLQGWIQAFGQTATQDRRDGIDGYDADTYGVAVGLDTANAIKAGTLGVALSYADTEVDSNNANRTNSNVNSYQLSVYGDYDIAPQTYLSGSLAYARNNIDQTRTNVGGVAGLTANADYDSNQYIAYLEAGREYMVGNRTSLTPNVLAHYQHISINDYTETGAGGANLNVNNEDLNIFELGVGAELAWDLNGDNGSKIRPAINVGYRHDLIGDDVSSTSNFTGGGASFQTNGLEAANGTGNVGASISYAMDNNWAFTADYDYEVKSDYDAHSGYVRAGYKF